MNQISHFEKILNNLKQICKNTYTIDQWDKYAQEIKGDIHRNKVTVTSENHILVTYTF